MAERKLIIEKVTESEGSSGGPSVPITNEKPVKNIAERYSNERPEVKSLVTQRRQKKEDGFWDKFKRAWFGDTVDNVADHVIFEIAVPAAKATLADMISNGFEILLFGQSSGRRTGSRSATQAGYSGMYRRESSRDRIAERRRDVLDTAYVWETVDPPLSKAEGRSVLADMRDIAEDHDYVTVAETLTMIGFQKNDIEWTWEGRGWYPEDLRNDIAGLREVRGGYILDLPRPRDVRSGRRI